MTKQNVLERLRSTQYDVMCPCLDLRVAAADEIERLRAAMTGLLQSLESDVHGMIDVRAAEARAVLAGSVHEPAGNPDA